MPPADASFATSAGSLEASGPAGPAAPGGGVRIGYLGPAGTFTEQALVGQTDLAGARLVPMTTMPDVLFACAEGEIDLGFVAVENAIEGTVNVTVDTLCFDVNLFIQREVVMPVQMNLLVGPGTELDGVRRVASFGHASSQCRRWLRDNLPAAELVATNSTAEAAELVANSGDAGLAAIANARAAEVYGLRTLAADIEDHPENSTRFVLVAPSGVPKATGHDKTSVVVYQQEDRPGSLIAILQEFVARDINLTKLESRPTKKGLGDYCFVFDLEGHIRDEVVADCLRNLKAKQADVKFLGSYPAAGAGHTTRAEVAERFRSAEAWVDSLRSQIA